MTLLHAYTTAPYWVVWREWFLSGWVGLVVVAPLVIGLARISHANKCIGAPNQRKLLCSNDFLAIRKRPDDDKL